MLILTPDEKHFSTVQFLIKKKKQEIFGFREP